MSKVYTGKTYGDKTNEMPLLAGRYRAVKALGQGGMGSVWLAEDEKLDGHPVALKMLPSVLFKTQRAYEQVKKEALVSLKLSHTNIATVRAFEEVDGNPFLVMDYIDGQTLDDYLYGRGQLSEEETVRLLGPVADALDYAHKVGVVHRDVKPGNVMIAKDGTPYVLDFGIAREIHETVKRVTGKDSSGTLMYMSPEQLNGAEPEPPQDVYSFAAMVYECLTGHAPFYRGQIEYQIVNNPPEPLPATIMIGSQVMAGLAKASKDRPLTCRDILKRGVSAKEPESPKPTPPPPPAAAAPDQPQQKFGRRNILVALGIVGAVALGFLLSKTSDNNTPRTEPPSVSPTPAKQIAQETRRDSGLYKVIDLADGTVTHLDSVPSGGWTDEYKTTKLVMRRIEAGVFEMGSPTSEEGRYSDEEQHTETLTEPYYIGVFEVTQGQWNRVMGNNPSYFSGETRPVEKVSWDDCQSFCRKAGRSLRLPTETEWEYACRAGTTTAFAGSLDAMGWYSGNSGSQTHEVGTKRPNDWGLYDMHGNVWEWCNDASGEDRVNRGGGWSSVARFCRSARRGGDSPGYRDINLGFRLCCSAGPSR